MKKFLAILFSLVVLMTFMAIPTFAVNSPSGSLVYDVDVESFSTGSATVGSYKVDGDTIILTAAKDSKHTFTGWVISGKEGVDYVIVSGSLDSKELVIRPLADLKIEESYDVKGSAGYGQSNDSDKAPQTGNNTLMVVTLLTGAAFVAMVSTRKAVKA